MGTDQVLEEPFEIGRDLIELAPQRRARVGGQLGGDGTSKEVEGNLPSALAEAAPPGASAGTPDDQGAVAEAGRLSPEPNALSESRDADSYVEVATDPSGPDCFSRLSPAAFTSLLHER